MRAGRPILVTGAAGKTGRAVIRALVAKGTAVRAFVYRAPQREVVAALGADEVVAGDLRSRDTVATAVAGIDTVYLICPNVHPDELGIGRRMVAAALAAGVGRIVYHSVLHPQIEAMPHHWNKMRVEELLFASGLDYTILQPAPYMQNLLGQWRSVTEQAVYPVPYELDTRIAMVDLEDVAEVAAQTLCETDHAAATYELCGPDLLDQREIAAMLSRVLGKTVRARAVPAGRWAEEAAASGLGTHQVETLRSMFVYYGQFGMAGSPRVLESLLGRPPTRFEEFLRRTVAIEPPATDGPAGRPS